MQVNEETASLMMRSWRRVAPLQSKLSVDDEDNTTSERILTQTDTNAIREDLSVIRLKKKSKTGMPVYFPSSDVARCIHQEKHCPIHSPRKLSVIK